MPTRKQVRRRLKQRRHEYEEVYLDADGNEISADEYAQLTGNGDASQGAERKPQQRRPSQQRRSGRTIQPPSWRRVLKRGAIFAPLMYLTVTLLAPANANTRDHITSTAFLLVIFLPFSYVMDAMTYRMWRRRTGRLEMDKRG